MPWRHINDMREAIGLKPLFPLDPVMIESYFLGAQACIGKIGVLEKDNTDVTGSLNNLISRRAKNRSWGMERRENGIQGTRFFRVNLPNDFGVAKNRTQGCFCCIIYIRQM